VMGPLKITRRLPRARWGITWEGEGEAGVAGGGRAGGRGRGGAAGRESDFGAYQIVGVPVCLLVGWSFIGCGLIAWQQRRGNRLGPVMIFIGFAWFATFIFATLGLPPSAYEHRRVIAVLTFLNSQ